MGALFIFIWVELIRIFKISYISSSIDLFMKEYVDSRDQGLAILTHIYLLCGCAAPLWLSFPKEEYIISDILVWMSGIVSLGIGDSMVF